MRLAVIVLNVSLLVGIVHSTLMAQPRPIPPAPVPAPSPIRFRLLPYLRQSLNRFRLLRFLHLIRHRSMEEEIASWLPVSNVSAM
jgi:hypothetical protein